MTADDTAATGRRPAAPADLSTQAVLEVDLDAVVANYRLLAAKVGDRTVCAPAVKADAYGLGMALVAPALFAAGARLFFVAHLAEGLALRALLPEAEIAVLNGLVGPEVADIHAAGLTPVLNDMGAIALWRAEGHGRPAFVHIDTGMNRLGLDPDAAKALIERPDLLDGIALRGWMSHMACADTPGHPLNVQQLSLFHLLLRNLPQAPGSLANSSSIFLGAPYHFEIARPGCALYGINPTPAAANPMRAAVRLLAPVLQVRTVSHAGTVGYGATARVEPGQRLATISIGYADGFLRCLGNGVSLALDGRPVPVVGRVSMDLVTVDVSDLPEGSVVPGASRVEVLGETVTVDTLAAAAGTIGYEILTALGSRFRRDYHSSEFPECASSRRSAAPS
ncbi:MAG: alanine racemase [Rhodospirillaceae bacterium]|nr:alanine racemase [Rhodospirillaceae bacterium]